MNGVLCLFHRHRSQNDQQPDPQPPHIYQGLDANRQHPTYSVINNERVASAVECSRLKLDTPPDPQPPHIYQGLDANRQHRAYSDINQERVVSAGEYSRLKLKPILIGISALLMILLNEVNVYSVSLRHMNVSLFECSIYLYFKLHVVMCINKYFFYFIFHSSN